MQAIWTFAVPIPSYSFGIISWNEDIVKEMNKKIRKILAIHEQHYPRADTDFLYDPRKEGGGGGGGGLIQTEET